MTAPATRDPSRCLCATRADSPRSAFKLQTFTHTHRYFSTHKHETMASRRLQRVIFLCLFLVTASNIYYVYTETVAGSKPVENELASFAASFPTAALVQQGNQSAVTPVARIPSAREEETDTYATPSRRNDTMVESYPYWNLSCPLEMSTFSAAHMDVSPYLETAYNSLEIAYEAGLQLKKDWKGPRRIFFVGDSLMRQVFIAMGCLLADDRTEYSIPWFRRRSGRTNHPNTVPSGPHSKFEEGRVWLSDGSELIYHHGVGRLLQLNEDYRSYDDGYWLVNCMRRQPFSAKVVTKQRHNFGTETNVKRESVQLHRGDLVLINGSVHGDRKLNLNTIADLMQCMERHTDMKASSWPQFAYVATGAEHFPTESGKFDESLTDRDDFKCVQVTEKHLRFDEEDYYVGHLMPIIGRDVLDVELARGDLHVGGRDCLHWAMPGIPDLLASSIVRSTIPMLRSGEELISSPI